MNYNSDLLQLENKLNSLKEELSSTKGQCSLLSEQITTSEHKIEELNINKEIYRKSVELLILVQKETNHKIQKGFQDIVTYALRYVYNDDYAFDLDFGRRGNLQELDFNIKTPSCKTAFDPKDTSGGGVLNIVSLALRIALLELHKPKIEGFLILDEPFAQINGKEKLEQAEKFLKAINKRINRQIIMVTNGNQMVNTADNIIKL
ncbi:hypothetical protein LCGC14_1748140 [marine sediment metagenome]|uniref:RecF/RecN/SMC N-terminal domain-containing protein n=1 Tax=marine sediment metagenome TaxID=412755 RepID=A0A0F9JJW2_9ZZZZ